MKKETYFLKNQVDPLLVETCHSVINWLDWIGLDAIASPDLIVLIEQFYFES
jgi:hypothetical protein